MDDPSQPPYEDDPRELIPLCVVNVSSTMV